MSDFISPLGLLVRGMDRWASDGGAYHAKRSRDGRPRLHEGIDFVAVPGTPLVAPAPSRFIRFADPYPDAVDSRLGGAVLRTPNNWEIKFLYCRVDDNIREGRLLRRGERFAVAQSLQKLYPGIQDHVHVEVFNPSGERVNPTPWFIETPPEHPPQQMVLT